MLSTVLLVAVAMATLLLPGLLVGWFLRLRGLLWVVLAPLITFVVAAAAGMWLRRLDLPWNTWSALVVFALAAGLAALVTRLLDRGEPGKERERIRLPAATPRWAYAGPVLGSLAALLVVGQGMDWDVGAVNQSWDPAWHVNLIAYIADTDVGDWAATRNNQLGWDGHFYPTGLHVVEALVLEMTGQNTMRVFNVFFALSVVLLPWPLFLLGRVAAPGWPVVAAVAAGISVLLPDQPWVQIGTQPWTWSMTAMPAAVAMALLAATARTWVAAPAGAVAVAATLALQPAGLASTLVVLGCFVLAGALSLRGRLLAVGRLAAMGLATAVVLSPMLEAGRSSVESVATFFSAEPRPLAGSLRQAFLLESEGLALPPHYVLAVGALVGLGVSLWRRELRWLGVAHLVLCGLHIASRSAPTDIRPFITGLWYSDQARLARLQDVTVVLLVGVAVAAGIALAARLHAPQLRRAGIVLVPAVLVLGLALQPAPVGKSVEMVAIEYQEHPGGPNITDQQVAVLEAAAPLFGEDEHVVVDSWQGGIMLFALTGVRATVGRYGDPDAYESDLLLRHVDEVDTNAAVRRVVVQNQVCGIYVGEGSVVPRDWRWTGYDELDEVRAYEQVYSDESSELYLLRGPLAHEAGCKSARGDVPELPDTITLAEDD